MNRPPLVLFALPPLPPPDKGPRGALPPLLFRFASAANPPRGGGGGGANGRIDSHECPGGAGEGRKRAGGGGHDDDDDAGRSEQGDRSCSFECCSRSQQEGGVPFFPSIDQTS